MDINKAESKIKALEICLVREEVGSKEYYFIKNKIDGLKRDIERAKNPHQKQIVDFEQQRLKVKNVNRE